MTKIEITYIPTTVKLHPTIVSPEPLHASMVHVRGKT